MAILPFRVKALYDYVSREEDDLKFKGDQVITVTDEEDADWYYGEYEDSTGAKQEGLFPKNFVKIFEPETPPRPQRAGRPKKDVQPSSSIEEVESPDVGPGILSPYPEEMSSAPQSQPQSHEAAHGQIQQRDELQAKEIAPPPPTAKPSSKTPAGVKPAPPPVSDKPASNAFRDRINAFNKPAAPPVAPAKPGGLGGSSGSSFIKKAFVAPPPSKNAYVVPFREPPPQKVYRREEDPTLMDPDDRGLEEAKPPPLVTKPEESEDDQPKPTSLKERIALLQKQQMEQAARHAEGSQKKEKPKRPNKPLEAEEASKNEEDSEGEPLDRVISAEIIGKRSMDVARKSRKSRDDTPVGSPVVGPSRDILSDGNDADQSGGGDTEDGEEISTGRDDSDAKPAQHPSFPSPATTRPQAQESVAGVLDQQVEKPEDIEDEEEDEVDLDPEVKRRMEIRERMAKMSGGMGMAGMFGPQGGLPPKSSTKKTSASIERKDPAHAVLNDSASRAPPVSLMPMPGMQKVQSPEQSKLDAEGDKEVEEKPRSVLQERYVDDIPDLENIEDELVGPTKSFPEQGVIQPMSQVGAGPALAIQGRAPPPLPSERPVPFPPTISARPAPPPPPRQAITLSEGSESDDELSSHERRTADADNLRLTSKDGRPHPASETAPSIPYRPRVPHSQALEDGLGESEASPVAINKSNILPITSLPSAPQSRAPPPPPPPSAAPPNESSTGERSFAPPPKPRQQNESDEEVTEYDGDYDTDIASGVAHKDALKAHARSSSLEDIYIAEEESLHHSGLPSIGPPQNNAPRAVPPPVPPPSAPQSFLPSKRQSSDVPRGAPPPPPPPKQAYDDQIDEYDPYNYSAPVRRPSSSRRETQQMPRTPTVEEPEPSYAASSPQYRRAPTASQAAAQHPPSPIMSLPSTSNSRQSSDMQRTSTTIRRSTEISRPSGEHFMAGDIDLAQASHWWTQTGAPPPVFQNRRDIIFEVEENSTVRRGGKKSIAKDVYVLYMDYSQTVITAHFEAADPSTTTLLEQRHEPPPRTLRQDQLEKSYSNFGARVADTAKSREGSTIGDGTPAALPFELISTLVDALRPVGVRSYGALVYANLANASVLQHDEIRPGDIVTFRNAKLGGHRGPMKSKYTIEVGKPDHVGVVVDWDGTKKKVRAWEQGRENKKVKVESFKFGDLKSGEVKVWRVMGRDWVGWGTAS